jgi:threonine dehydratase
MSDTLPNLADIRAAAERIAPYSHETAVLTSRRLDEWLGCHAFLKCENFQRTGAFKFRGACNAVMSLSDAEAARGVVTHSSGNHGAAVAEAARLRGIPAWVVMPVNSAPVKRTATEGYGATVVDCQPTQTDRERTAARVVAETGATLIHPYDDARIIAGQATAGLELHRQIPGLNAIVCPVGGGGLASGSALSTSMIAPQCRILLGEPEAADDAFLSLQRGEIVPLESSNTVADGLRTSLGVLTFAVIRRHAEQIITVSEAEIIEAMRFIWTRVKILIEPSSAVAVAAVRRQPDLFTGQRVGILLTGGNVDLDQLPRLLQP